MNIKSFQALYRSLILIVILVLLFLTVMHLPIPVFRGYFFERIREIGLWLICAWLLVALAIVVRFFGTSRKAAARQLVVVFLGIACLSVPILRFQIPPSKILSEGRPPSGTVEFRLLVTRDGALRPEIREYQSADVWLAEGVVSDQNGVYAQGHELHSPDGGKWTLFVKQPVRTIRELPLVAGFISGWRIEPAVSTESEFSFSLPPVFLFVTREQAEPRDKHRNYLALRRLAGILKQEKQALLVSDLQVSPWSGGYGILTAGAQFVNTAWGEMGAVWDRQELLRGGLVHMKGAMQVSEFSILHVPGSQLTGRLLEFYIPIS